MNHTALRLSENLPLSFIYWLPRLAYLQLLWFLSVLPVITLVTASRTLLDSLVNCQQQETSLNTIFKIYKLNFMKRLQTNVKIDIVYGLYFLFMLIDSGIFWQLHNPAGHVFFYTVILISWFSVLIFIYQTLASKQRLVNASFLYSFYILCKRPGLIFLHIVLPMVSFICLFFIGGIYLCLAGASGFFWLNMKIAQKNTLL